MENYTYELAKQNKIIELEKSLEREYPEIKVSGYLHRNQKDIIIVICDRAFHFIKAYVATDFDCKHFKEDYLHQMYKELPKSDKYASDKEIRQFYLRFMKNNFETYYDDYKAYQLKLIDEDLDVAAHQDFCVQ